MLKANGWGNIGSANITKRKVEVALMDGGSLISPTFCFLNKITGWLKGSTLWLGQLWRFPSRLKPVPRLPTPQLLIKVIKWLPKTLEEKTWPQPWPHIPQVLTKTPHWGRQDGFAGKAACCTSMKTQVWPTGSMYRWKERTKFTEVFSDLHTHSVACAYPHTHHPYTLITIVVIIFQNPLYWPPHWRPI